MQIWPSALAARCIQSFAPLNFPPAIWGEHKARGFKDSLRRSFEDIKQENEPLIANNLLFHSWKLASPEVFISNVPLKYPMARHRLVVPHEGSGRKNLYVTTYAHHFDGETMEESKQILDNLLEHVSQEKYVLNVHYENNGDIAMG